MGCQQAKNQSCKTMKEKKILSDSVETQLPVSQEHQKPQKLRQIKKKQNDVEEKMKQRKEKQIKKYKVDQFRKEYLENKKLKQQLTQKFELQDVNNSSIIKNRI